ncbi:RICIN domain-containing protein [Micromonospora sp. NPDC018662]|uniref:RICIN domain-containing protein n=1 Tax=Micromonospora sp. NPDC018662 TaxID=3364238 RepID=UPI00378ACF93
MNRELNEDEWDQARDWERVADGSDPDQPQREWTVSDTGGADADAPADPAADPDAATPGPRVAPTKIFVAAGAVLLGAAIGFAAVTDRSDPVATPSGPGPQEPAESPAPGFTEPPVEAAESPSPPVRPTPSGPAPTDTDPPPPPPAASRSRTAERTPAPRSPKPSAARQVAPVAYSTPRAGITVRLVSLASGKSAGVSQGSGADGARIAQSGDAAGPAQHWRMVAGRSGCYQLINVRSGKSLDNTDGTSTNGMQMQQWTWYQASANQSWCFQSVGSGRYSIRNMTSGFLLDIRDGGTADGVAVQQWNADPAAPNANQTWLLARVS